MKAVNIQPYSSEKIQTLDSLLDLTNFLFHTKKENKKITINMAEIFKIKLTLCKNCRLLFILFGRLKQISPSCLILSTM